jgi:nicotinate-nucleotide pyrophosphorylase (carboxylating)
MLPLDPSQLGALVRTWLDEDVGRGDVTTTATITPGTMGRARIEARQAAVVAGVEVAAACFEELAGDEVKWVTEVEDGGAVEPGQVIARLEGPLATILVGERTALNILQRLSGVATMTARFVAAVEGTGASIVDTRKTTPGLRVLEKYAVGVGGGRNHRMGLDDGVLIKDNHIAAAGGIDVAVQRAKEHSTHGLKIEVEVADLRGLDVAIEAGADIVMLDNMEPDLVAEAVKLTNGRAVLEASGGINIDNVREFAATGVDLISVGALTHSAPAIDIALEVESL